MLNVFKENSELSEHIFNNLLKKYILNTMLILIPTTFISLLLGFLSAYFEVFFEYRFRAFFKYMNILSFAIPSYIFAYIYVDIFSSYIYTKFSIYYDIANIKGAIFILSISFYPYVYIVSKAYMKKISMDLIYVSKTLGKSNIYTFFKVILPISRPALVVGSSLVIMEVLNSFGVPYFFGIQVFSTGIYETWINYYDLDGAMKLSAVLLIFVLILLLFENYFRKPFIYNERKIVKIKREKLIGYKEILVILFYLSIFIFSLLIPFLYLLRWVKYSYTDIYLKDMLRLSFNTLSILFFSSILILMLALFLSNVSRLYKRKYSWIIDKLVSLGYSIPSSITAIGFLSIFIFIDKLILKDELFFSKSVIVIVFAYATRFLSLAYNGIKASINKIGNNYHESSRLLGKSALKTFFKVDIYMLKGSIFSAFLLVSIEILKEMPIAALLLNRNTLAIQMKNYAQDERLAMVAIPSLILISICMFLLVLYNKGEE